MKIGDVVRLKSGGPKMVVDSSQDAVNWFCLWFPTSGPQEGVACRASFHKDTLEPLETVEARRLYSDDDSNIATLNVENTHGNG